MNVKVQTGLDILLDTDFEYVRGAKIGLLAGANSVDSQLRHIADLLFATKSCSLIRLFAPENGLRGEHQDMEESEVTTDSVTGLPLFGLYSDGLKNFAPKKEMVEGIDILVVDLQEFGSRTCTYIQSLSLAMKAAALAGIKVLVLDRPNPIGGIATEGASLTPRCISYCGSSPIAHRHGLTIAEIAKLLREGFGTGENAVAPIDCELFILPMNGWKREMYFHDTKLPWVMPSPNIPIPETLLAYVGTRLFEGTLLSEGRGTPRPFEIVGAPFIKGQEWVEKVREEGIPLEGVILRPLTFVPQFHKWHGKPCGGVQIHVTDPRTFQPFRCALVLLTAAAHLYREFFVWHTETYQFVEDILAIDLLYGGYNFRKWIEAKKPILSLMNEIEQFESWYEKARKPYFIYEIE